MSKKAMAPLISTIVLILFAAGLGIVVMNWGSTAGYAIESIGGCDKASVNVIEINNKADMCFKDNTFIFTLENNGEINVDSLKISFIGDEIYQTELYEKYFVGDIKKKSVKYEDIGNLLKVKIAPMMGVEVCTKQCIGIEDIREC